jgi:hypothetical protein
VLPLYVTAPLLTAINCVNVGIGTGMDSEFEDVLLNSYSGAMEKILRFRTWEITFYPKLKISP